MTNPIRLSTMKACRVAGINRDRFNEHVAAGYFRCAPETVPGRARMFDPDDMVALKLFVDLIEDGLEPRSAGPLACEVAQAAKANPDAAAISVVYTYFKSFHAYPADAVPTADRWDTELFSGTDIRKVMTFRISKTRALIEHYTAQEIADHVDPADID